MPTTLARWPSSMRISSLVARRCMIRRSVFIRCGDVGTLELDHRLAAVGQHARVDLGDRRGRQRRVVEATGRAAPGGRPRSSVIIRADRRGVERRRPRRGIGGRRRRAARGRGSGDEAMSWPSFTNVGPSCSKPSTTPSEAAVANERRTSQPADTRRTALANTNAMSTMRRSSSSPNSSSAGSWTSSIRRRPSANGPGSGRSTPAASVPGRGTSAWCGLACVVVVPILGVRAAAAAPVADDSYALWARWRRRHRSRPGQTASDDRAHRRRDLHRFGHPRLPRAERGVDHEPRPPRSSPPSTTTWAIRRGPAAVVAGPAGEPGVGRRAQRRPPRAGRPGAARRAPGRRHPEHRPAPPEGRLVARAGDRGAREHGRGRLLDCGARSLTQEALERLEAGDDDPACLVCGGILKTATVMFGQTLDPEVLEAAAEASRRLRRVRGGGHARSRSPRPPRSARWRCATAPS